MVVTILILAALASVMLLLAVVTWNVLAWPKIAASTRSHPQSVSVLIPARNEERNLAACLDAVLRQGETVAEVLVYDDHSTDATPLIVGEYVQRDSRVRLIRAVALAPGWCGKNFACAQLAREARAEWMLFLDADARLATDAVARIVEEAQRREVTFLSCWPGLTLLGFWEKALMPMLNFAVFTLFPAPLSLMREDASLGLAHGACLMAHRATYESIGGHTAVRNEIFEDTRLARLWRTSGERGLCLDGQQVVSVRMYDSLGAIWSGFQKNFFPAFRHESSFWVFLALHASIFLVPFILIFLTAASSVWAIAACVLAMRALLAWRFRHPWWSVFLHPLSEIILIALGLSSWWRCKSGKGMEWKGRQYHKHEAGGA
ncbi:MAG: glycosyltransferase family 2 protein [Acidobacteriota bacterium]